MTDPTLEGIAERLDLLDNRVSNYQTELEKVNDRFENYQKATQQLVGLAFSLVASATITVILTTVFRR